MRRAQDVVQRISAAFASSSHAPFTQLLEAALLPCTLIILSRTAQPATLSALPPSTDVWAREVMDRGRAWALLGMARLHLVQPPAGVDPAGKAAMKQAHLLRTVQEEVEPLLQVCDTVHLKKKADTALSWAVSPCLAAVHPWQCRDF